MYMEFSAGRSGENTDGVDGARGGLRCGRTYIVWKNAHPVNTASASVDTFFGARRINE